MNIRNKKILQLLFLFTIILSMVLSLFYTVTLSSAKTKNTAAFAQKYKAISLQNKIQYQIKNLKNTEYVRFSLSDSSLASIQKKSGILTPKKAGNVTVIAKVYNKRHKKIKVLRDKISITQKSILKNAIFAVKDTINPWNFTLTLSCNRILLKNEISHDILTILPKGKKAPKLIANFTSLSSDGKEITYTLSSSSQKKLCPGDYSMDGNYVIESTCFIKKLSLTYQERITENTLSGFILKENGNPIKNALLSLKRKGQADITCLSDQNGYYQFQNILNPLSLTAQKSGYQSKTITNLSTTKTGTTCENIILYSTDSSTAAIEFLITDEENIPLSDTAITILKTQNTIKNTQILQISDADTTFDPNTTLNFNKDDIIYSTCTDTSGTVLFTNTNFLTASPCSRLTLDQTAKLSYSASLKLTSKNIISLPESLLNTQDQYTILIHKFSPANPNASYQTVRVDFSFYDLITRQAKIHIKLKKCKKLHIPELAFDYPDKFSDFSSLTLYLYHPKQTNFFYQYSVPKEQLIQEASDITFFATLPIGIPDGTYYISLRTISSKNTILASSAILPVLIKQGTLSLKYVNHITLYSPRFARALAYTNSDKNVITKNSFFLYQRCNSFFFLIDTFPANPIKSYSDFYTYSVLLENLIPKQQYLLLYANQTFINKEDALFLTTEENTYLSKNSAVYSVSPITKILCTELGQTLSTSLLQIPEVTSTAIFYQKNYTISQDFIRSSKTYPNCVMAFYRSDGTLLSKNLTLPPANQNFIPSSNDGESILDIYTNKEILITNQDSYI